MGSGCILEHLQYHRAKILSGSRLAAERTGRRSQVSGGRPKPHPADEAASLHARPSRRSQLHSRQRPTSAATARYALGAMTRHAEIAASADAARIPILHDCAAGIADPQVRTHGHHRRLHCRSRSHRRLGARAAGDGRDGDTCSVPTASAPSTFSDFILDAYTTALQPGELITEIVVPLPAARSGGAYIALKRCAPVYASASVAVQLTWTTTTLAKRRTSISACLA